MKYFILLIVLLVCVQSIYAQADYAELVWARKYYGYDSTARLVNAMTIDDAGNVYLAVDDIYYLTSDSNLHYVYVVLKYNSAGDEELVLRYEPSVDSANTVSQLIVDKSGNIYVAGSANYGTLHKLLKYTSSGNLQWAATDSSGSQLFTGDHPPFGLAVDKSGNIFMAGEKKMFKYNSNGERIWMVPKNIFSMAVDHNEYIYLKSPGTVVKYNSEGIKQWEVSDTLGPASIVTDNEGSAFVNNGYKGIEKYGADGTQRWATLYGEEYYYVFNFSLDNEGNAVVLGLKENDFYSEYATMKYNTDGVKLWEALYAGEPVTVFDHVRGPSGVCTDRYNNIYVTGSSYDKNGEWRITVIKYSPAGEKQWIVKYEDDPPQTRRIPLDVKVDTSGNVYVTGFYVSQFKDFNVVTLKYKQPNFPTSVNRKEAAVHSFHLYQNYPNPFNPTTVISYRLPVTNNVTLKIFDLLGREVTTLVNEEKPVGSYEVQWNAAGYSSGVYFYRIQSGSFADTKRMALMK